MCPSILVEAFRKSGVYPINRLQISYDQARPSVVYAGVSTISAPAGPPIAPAAFTAEEAAHTFTSFFSYTRPITQQTVNPLPVTQQTVPLGAMTSPLQQQGALFTHLERHIQQSDGPMSAAFLALESELQSPVRLKYRRRLNEGYDLPDSPTY